MDTAIDQAKKDSMKNFICVFCGAQNAVPKKHLDAGRELGHRMAANNLALVYGGGDCGVMGAVANAVMEKGGWATGVFPKNLRAIEEEHKHLSEIVITDGMHARKELMYDRSNMFVIMPGGFGTMDEMFEIITWRQIGLHKKPVIIFNHDGYWDHLVALMNNIIATGFATKETAEIFEVYDDMDDLLERLTQ
jgi:uncharacterized protein (TIGR00730 family)